MDHASRPVTPEGVEGALPENAASEIITRIADGIVTFDGALRCRYVNPRGAEILGRPASQIVGTSLAEAFAGLAGSGIVEAAEQAARAGRQHEHEGFVRPWERWYQSRIMPLTDGILVFLVDVTARRRAEADVHEREARLVRAQAVASIGSWELDLVTGSMWGSEEAFRIYGLAKVTPSLPFETVRVVPFAEDRPRLDLAMRGLLAGTDPYDIQFRIRRVADGATRVVHSMAEVVRDESGTPLRVAGTIQDITERQAIDEDRFRLVRAIEQASDIVMLEGTDRRLIYVNPSFTRLYGFAAEEVIGRPPDFLDSGFHPPSFWEARDAEVRADRTWSGTIHNRCRDGTVVEVDATISPVRGDDGAIVGYVQVARNVTAQHALEARLAEAQRMEAVGQLAGGIAHDFNNLLTAIRGYAGVVLDGLPEGDAERRADISQIIEGADRAADLTRQLLAYSRRQVLEPAVVDPVEVTHGVLPLLRRLIGEHIDLRFTHAGPGGCVRVDPGQLEQVIVNLAVNARDAMPGGGRLTVSTGRIVVGERAVGNRADTAGRVQPAQGPFMRISVTDTGTGIDPATQPRIFDPFFTTKGPAQGTGMGLATVQGIVTQSGGFVTVESTVGVGTTFHVDLPEVEGPPAPGIIRTAPSPVRGTETVLVVEDDDAVRRFARRVLSDRGYVVVDAAEAKEAQRIAAELGDDLDVLLTDLVMPGMSGNDLAVRLVDHRPNLRVVLASGYAEDAVGAALAPEQFVFLAKPYSSEALVSAVRRALGADGVPAGPVSAGESNASHGT